MHDLRQNAGTQYGTVCARHRWRYMRHCKLDDTLVSSRHQLPDLRIMKGDVDNHHENRYEDASLQQVAFLKLEAPEIYCQKHG